MINKELVNGNIKHKHTKKHNTKEINKPQEPFNNNINGFGSIMICILAGLFIALIIGIPIVIAYSI